MVIKDVSELSVDELLEYIKACHESNRWNSKIENDVIERLAELWNECSDIQEPTIEQLKKQIKYSKNPMEVKRLNMKLNQTYKKRRKHA